MSLIKLLDRPIAFQRQFVVVTGSVNAALMLSQAIYWHNRSEHEGQWFYKSQKEWQDETGLSRSEQETARKILKSLGFISEKLKGLPANLWFKVDAENLQASLLESCKLECDKPSNLPETTPQATNTESTSESTADIKVVDVQEQSQVVYRAYPRKVGRPKALDSIVKAIKKHGFDVVLSSTGSFAKAWEGFQHSELQFCPHPTTWFNQERYLDNPETWKRTNGTKPVKKPYVQNI